MWPSGRQSHDLVNTFTYRSSSLGPGQRNARGDRRSKSRLSSVGAGATPAAAGRPYDTINTLFRWGRVGSTGDAPLGLQAEAPSHLVKRWQNCNWQASASPSRLRVATSTASSPRRWRLGAANRGATLLTPIRKAKTIGWPLRAPALDRAVEARSRYQLSL